MLQHRSAEQTSGRPLPPFPQRFHKQQQDTQFKKFLDVLKQLHINIPLVEALEQMPKYARFMKDILLKKRRFGEFETVALTEECSAIFQNKLPPKLRDPGSFTIPCAIGNEYFGKALCDLGASINLMPMSVFKKLGVGEARPTTVTLQLADRSLAHPEGKIEDVLVKVDKFIFPADFIVLDFEADKEVPIILGRPFLATGRTLIDVQKGELTMRVNDEQVTFKVLKAMRLPDEVEECSSIKGLDSIGLKKLGESCCYKDPPKSGLMPDQMHPLVKSDLIDGQPKDGVLGKDEARSSSTNSKKESRAAEDTSPTRELVHRIQGILKGRVRKRRKKGGVTGKNNNKKWVMKRSDQRSIPTQVKTGFDPMVQWLPKDDRCQNKNKDGEGVVEENGCDDKEKVVITFQDP